MALLEVKGICKNFGRTEVLKGIDFSLEKGEVLAISAHPEAARQPSCAVSTSLRHPTAVR